jgi:hypothetical protein
MDKTLNKLLGAFLLVGALLISSLPSLGQNYQSFNSELDVISQTTKWKIGPFRLAPLFLIRDLGYDTNIYGMRSEDHPVADTTATLSPRITAYLLFRNWLILSFLENPEYVYYFKEKSERSWNNSYSPALKLLVAHRFVLSGSYHFRKSRRRASSEFDVRADEKVKGTRGSFFYETARRTSLGISGSYDQYRYEDTRLPGQETYLSQALNRQERNLSFEIYYRIFSQSFFFINGGYTDYDFEFEESSWKNSYSYQSYLGIRFPLLGRARGTVSLGYKRFLPRHAEVKSFSGLVGNSSLDFRLGRFGLRLRYNRDSTFSYYVENIFFVENIYGTGASFYVTEFLRLDYDFTYGANGYPEPVRIPLPEGGFRTISREDRYRIHSAGFVFRVFRDVGVGLMLNLWDRDSNYIFESNRRRWFVGGYLTYEF